MAILLKYNSRIMENMEFPPVVFHTLGCKLNQAESEELSYLFADKGYRPAENGNAGIVIINTCTVTHIADRKARHILRFTRKNNPDAIIVVTGCAAERAASEFRSLGADIIIGNAEKKQLPDIIRNYVSKNRKQQTGNKITGINNRIRSFIKIQDGCRHFCTYCIVPYVRSREYSIPAAEIIDRIKQRVSLGYNEAVLTGTRVGSYKVGTADLKDLIEEILEDTGIKRLHLSSLQPGEISADLIKLWNNERLIPHFHLALQSGSQTVLNRMHREYSINDYNNSVSLIRSLVPQASITTDIMVGFPGETEQEFEESLEFCRNTGFAAIHVFPYSIRPGTKAALMSDQVPDKTKKERSLRMLALAEEVSRIFNKQFIGTTGSVLFESEEKNSSKMYSGFSRHYVRVYTKSEKLLDNMIRPVKIISSYKNGLRGEIL